MGISYAILRLPGELFSGEFFRLALTKGVWQGVEGYFLQNILFFAVASCIPTQYMV